METKRILLEAYKERQQKAAAAGAIPSFYRKARHGFYIFGRINSMLSAKGFFSFGFRGWTNARDSKHLQGTVDLR